MLNAMIFILMRYLMMFGGTATCDFASGTNPGLNRPDRNFRPILDRLSSGPRKTGAYPVLNGLDG